MGGDAGLGVLYRYRLDAAATLSRVGAYPTEVTGGDTSYFAPTGIVILDGSAPVGGATVTLRSNRPGVLSVPASVKVSKNWSTAAFPIVTREVTSAKVVVLTATYRGVSRTVSLTVDSSQ